MAVSARTGY